MALRGEISKDPIERYSRGFTYAGLLPTGAALASGVVSAINLNDGSDATGEVLANPTAVVSGDVVSAQIFGGTDGIDYKISFVTTLNTGNPNDVFKDHIIIRVRNT